MIQILIVGLGLSFFVMFLWYIFQPVTISIINTTWEVATVQFGVNNAYVSGGVTILTWIVYWWGPIMVCAIAVLWAYVATQRRDWSSTRETY